MPIKLGTTKSYMSIVEAGAGYAVGDLLQFNDANGLSLGKAEVKAVGGSGEVADFEPYNMAMVDVVTASPISTTRLPSKMLARYDKISNGTPFTTSKEYTLRDPSAGWVNAKTIDASDNGLYALELVTLPSPENIYITHDTLLLRTASGTEEVYTVRKFTATGDIKAARISNDGTWIAMLLFESTVTYPVEYSSQANKIYVFEKVGGVWTKTFTSSNDPVDFDVPGYATTNRIIKGLPAVDDRYFIAARDAKELLFKDTDNRVMHLTRSNGVSKLKHCNSGTKAACQVGYKLPYSYFAGDVNYTYGIADYRYGAIINGTAKTIPWYDSQIPGEMEINLQEAVEIVPTEFLAFSPDGTKVAFKAFMTTELKVKNGSGVDVRQTAQDFAVFFCSTTETTNDGTSRYLQPYWASFWGQTPTIPIWGDTSFLDPMFTESATTASAVSAALDKFYASTTLVTSGSNYTGVTVSTRTGMTPGMTTTYDNSNASHNTLRYGASSTFSWGANVPTTASLKANSVSNYQSSAVVFKGRVDNHVHMLFEDTTNWYIAHSTGGVHTIAKALPEIDTSDSTPDPLTVKSVYLNSQGDLVITSKVEISKPQPTSILKMKIDYGICELVSQTKGRYLKNVLYHFAGGNPIVAAGSPAGSYPFTGVGVFGEATSLFPMTGTTPPTYSGEAAPLIPGWGGRGYTNVADIVITMSVAP